MVRVETTPAPALGIIREKPPGVFSYGVPAFTQARAASILKAIDGVPGGALKDWARASEHEARASLFAAGAGGDEIDPRCGAKT
jgi:hypothetical protein